MTDAIREIRARIEYRDDESRRGPGRIVGTLLRYGEQAQDRRERFREGSLSWDESGIVLNRQHDRARPLARFTPTIEGREIRIDVLIPDTQEGRDAIQLVRSGVLRGLSVEFRSASESDVNGVREIRAAELLGAALVDDGSYRTSVEVRRGRNRLGRGRLAWWL